MKDGNAMHQHHAFPPLLQIFGRAVRYAAAMYLTFGMVLAVLWLTVQLIVSRGQLTIAAQIFFAGFSLLIILVVTGVTVTIIVLEQVIIHEINRAIVAIQQYAERDRQAADE